MPANPEILAVTPDTGFTLGAGATRTIAVAKPDDADTTYISAAGGLSLVTVGTTADTALTTETINTVTLRARARFVTTAGEPMQLDMSDDGFSHLVSTTPALTTSYADYTLASATAPSGGAWTVAKVNSLVSRISNNSDVATLRVTTWSVEVAWTAASGVHGMTLLGVG